MILFWFKQIFSLYTYFYGANISPSEHYINYITTHPILYEKYLGVVDEDCRKELRKVEIGNNVSISLNAIILEGVKIGKGAVIGAGVVVNKDVEPYEIVGGIPAEHIKYRFNKQTIDFLLELKWWDWDKEKIKRNIEFLKTGDV